MVPSSLCCHFLRSPLHRSALLTEGSINHLRRKQACKLMNQIQTVVWQFFCASFARSFCRGNEHHGIDPNILSSGHHESWLFHKGCVSLHSCQAAILPHVGTLNSATHPRGTCTRRNCSRQNGRHLNGDIEGPGWSKYTNDGMYSDKWQYCLHLSSHVQVVWGVCSKMRKQLHRMIVCLKFFEEHQIFRSTRRGKRIGYSMMAVFYTEFSIVLTVINF